MANEIILQLCLLGNLFVGVYIIYALGLTRKQNQEIIQVARESLESVTVYDVAAEEKHQDVEWDEFEGNVAIEEEIRDAMEAMFGEKHEEPVPVPAGPMHSIDREAAIEKVRQERLAKNPHRDLEIEIEDMFDDPWE